MTPNEPRPPADPDLDALRIDRGREGGRPTRGRAIVVLVVVACVVLPLAWWAFRHTVGVPVVSVAQVRELAPDGRAGGVVLNATGYVTARRRATVSSKITGKVIEVRVEEGDAVQAGQLLARLDDAHSRAALALARAELEAAGSAVAEVEARLSLAETTSHRTRRLLRDGVVGEADRDAAEAEVAALGGRLRLQREQVRVAERGVDLRQTELGDTLIVAPFDGVVISKDAQPGEMVSPVSAGGGFTRTGLCTIVDMGSLEIEVDVNESYIRRVREDQPVEAVLDAYPEWRIPARVITTIPAADRQKATVRVRIGFVALDPRILPDMGVKVAFLEPQSEAAPVRRTRVVVPEEALREADGQAVVFVVQGDRVERRAVAVAVAVAGPAGQREIVSGLAAGESVVVEGPATLDDGSRIRLR